MFERLLLAGLLFTLPASASGRFVCSSGMAEAGPACPRCHGHSTLSAPVASTHELASQCCRYVPGHAVLRSGLVPAQPERTTLAHGPLALESLDLDPGRRTIAGIPFDRGVRPPPSPHLSTVLRL